MSDVYTYPIPLQYPETPLSDVTVADYGGEVVWHAKPVVNSYSVIGSGWAVENGFTASQNGLQYRLNRFHIHTPAEHKLPIECESSSSKEKEKDATSKAGGGDIKKDVEEDKGESKKKNTSIRKRRLRATSIVERNVIEIHLLFVNPVESTATPVNELVIAYIAHLTSHSTSSRLFRRLAESISTPSSTPPSFKFPPLAPYWSYAAQAPGPVTSGIAFTYNVSSRALRITENDLKILSTHVLPTRPPANRRGRPVVFFCAEPRIVELSPSPDRKAIHAMKKKKQKQKTKKKNIRHRSVYHVGLVQGKMRSKR